MLKTFSGPGKYIQGYNAINEFGKYTSALGSRPFITGGRKALSIIREPIEKSCAEYNLKCEFSEFAGKGTQADVADIIMKARNFKADTIVGAGGGLSLDMAKAAAHETGLPLVIIPTIASTDAPCSAEALVYTEDHQIDKIIIMKRNPDIVIADSKIITEAPVRFLSAGMGDALATWFEASTCKRTGGRNFTDGIATELGMKAARMCYDILMEHGVQAKNDADKNQATPSVEEVIEANTLLSGMGFENCGLGIAHSVNVGLSILKETRNCLHGELVGFGVLVNLILENYPDDDKRKIFKFCQEVGLPVTLKQLGLNNPAEEQLIQVAEATLREPHMRNLEAEVNTKKIKDAIKMVDEIGRKALEKII